jgi:hypothetical protein
MTAVPGINHDDGTGLRPDGMSGTQQGDRYNQG